MQDIISILGMVAALAGLSFLVMKDVNIFVAAIGMSLLVALTGGINLYDALKVDYMSGFVGFVQSNFLIFVAGALMGKAYELTGGAKAIARSISKLCGPKLAGPAVVLASGILTYGGIAGFVVCFTVFPIALEVFRQADVPRRFAAAAVVFGCSSFSATGPGNPQVGQVVLVNALGSSLMDGAVVGFVATGVTFVVGTAIFSFMINNAKKNGEHFAAKDADSFQDDIPLPNGWVAMIPIVICLLTVNVKINGSAILPIEFGVVLGACLAFILMRKYRTDKLSISQHIGGSIKNAIVSVCNTSGVVGFGTVVRASLGFPALVSAITAIPGPPLVAVAVATTLLAGICGSGSGGLAIAAPILAPIYTAQGVPIAHLHRTMLVASDGLDSLPHNGFVVTVINGVANETHKTAYMPIFWMTVFTPLISTAIAIIGFTLFPNLP